MSLSISSKRVQIDKANLNIIIAVSIAVFVTVFCLIGSKALLSQRSYQARVIAKKEIARDNLTANLKAASTLEASYQRFVDTPENVIGGVTDGKEDRDGDNAKIVLDALPSKYDFPALATSLEKILSDSQFAISNIDGIDDELNQSAADKSVAPQVVETPFQVGVVTNAARLEELFTIFERSIRPFQIQELSISGTGNAQNVTIKAKTYYQPTKSLQIKKEVVK